MRVFWMFAVYSVRGGLCIVYCRLGICLLVDFDRWCVVSILVFVSSLACYDFSSLCLGSFADLSLMNPPYSTNAVYSL